MRIGIDARLWSETGVGRYIRNLVFHLQRIDEKNTYVLFVRKNDYEAVVHKIFNTRWKLVVADVRWHTIEEQIKLPAILDKENLDLVHFPYFSVPIFVNIPFVVTIHDLIIHHFSTGEASTLPSLVYKAKLAGYKYVIKQATQKAKRIITVSEATQQEILDKLHVPRSKVAVIYEGVDKGIKVEHSKKIIADPYFLHVGNVYPHKNMERAISAFQKVFKNSPMRFVIVGKRDFFMDRLKEFVRKKNLEDHVVFMGEVSDAELSSLYTHTIALVLPSLMEGFGLPAIEAMANNCLVLASDIPSLREICKDCALYYNPKDVSEIAQTMQHVVGKPKSFFADIREKGLARAKDFSWNSMAQETLHVYDSLMVSNKNRINSNE